MLTLVLVRHGESEHNAARRYHGHGDAPLTPAGRVQALALRERLARLTSSHQKLLPPAGGGREGGAAAAARRAEQLRVVSSDLGRARETAKIALPDYPLMLEPRLRELHFGAFEGYSHETCLALHGALYRSWLIGPSSVRPPGGETLAELESRVLHWLDTQPREGVTIAITHGGPIFVLLARLLDIPFDAARRAGLAHGDGVRLLLPSRPDAPIATPVWLSDELEGCGRARATERLAHALGAHNSSARRREVGRGAVLGANPLPTVRLKPDHE